jgi:hypothetical protein
MVWYVFLRTLRPELAAAAGGQNPQREQFEGLDSKLAPLLGFNYNLY